MPGDEADGLVGVDEEDQAPVGKLARQAVEDAEESRLVVERAFAHEPHVEDRRMVDRTAHGVGDDERANPRRLVEDAGKAVGGDVVSEDHRKDRLLTGRIVEAALACPARLRPAPGLRPLALGVSFQTAVF